MATSRSREALTAVAGPCIAPETDALQPLIARIRERWGETVRAVVYYGSCLRAGDPYAGLVDFYVVVSSYRRAHGNRAVAAFNALVPPNVYYLECPGARGTLRCKYALLSLSQLEAGARDWFQSGVWGRFSQPVAIAYAASESERTRVRAACGAAVLTLLERSLPALDEPAPPAVTFSRALALSYASELRVERATRGEELVADDADEYARRLEAARPLLSFTTDIDDCGRLRTSVLDARRRTEHRRWRLRRVQGRVLSTLRLAKACFTFSNAVDYAAWKLRRHTGVAIPVTPQLRRHPLIFGWIVLWRLYRARLVR